MQAPKLVDDLAVGVQAEKQRRKVAKQNDHMRRKPMGGYGGGGGGGSYGYRTKKRF